MFKSLRRTMGVAMIAAALGLSACGGTSPVAADPAASTPALSHYNADLTAGYTALQAIEIVTLGAAKSGTMSSAKAQAIQKQCKAFTATLDKLRLSSDQTILTATIEAITQLSILTASETVKS